MPNEPTRYGPPRFDAKATDDESGRRWRELAGRGSATMIGTCLCCGHAHGEHIEVRINGRLVLVCPGAEYEDVSACSCKGVGWVDDEGWMPAGWRPGERWPKRYPHDGLITCGFCNFHGERVSVTDWYDRTGAGES